MYGIDDVNVNLNIYKCEVCAKLLKNPIQLSPCGHRICMSCLPSAQPQVCPICHKGPTCVPANFSDIGFDMEMQAVMANCNECNSSCHLSEYRKHQEECFPDNHEFDVNMISAHLDGSRFECPICYSCFISDPIQFQCGHRFCISCCEELFVKCPVCRSEVQQETSFFDIGMMNDLSVSEFNCPNQNCQWSGFYNGLLLHKKKCQFKICSVCERVHFPNTVYDCRLPCQKCRRLILAEQLDAHEEDCDEYVEVPSYFS